MILSGLAVAVVASLQMTVQTVLIIMLFVILVGFAAGTKWGRVISLAVKFEVLILFWVLLEPFLYGSTVVASMEVPWGTLNVYSEGIYLGVLLGTRMFTILLAFLGALSHMTLADFIGGLRTLRVPASILGSMLIMFRYVPLFIEERSRMQDAQSLRGFDRGNRLERLRSIGNLVGTTIGRSFDRSVRVYESMSLRGFGRGMTVRGTGFRRSDAIIPLLLLGFILLLPYFASLLMEVLLL